ncbi:MAG: protein-export chaperone SecB [bacterium]|nr:protein-export chaperone SecB [bacterium]
MHIYVEGIFLTELQFKVFPDNPKLDYNLHVTCSSHFINDNQLTQIFNFDVMHLVEAPPFDLKFTLEARFLSEGEGEPTLAEFSKSNGPAYVVPYARELISNLTSRTDVPTLTIPPVNIFRLIEEERMELINDTMTIDDFINPEKGSDI